jgi:arginase family enzyme
MSLRAQRDWSSAAEWLAGGKGAELAVLGVGDERGIANAVRQRLRSCSTYHSERDVDVGDLDARDLGDVTLASVEHDLAHAIVALDVPELVVVIGPGGELVYPTFLGVAGNDLTAWGCVTVDAHHDVAPFDGLPPAGSVVRALVDGGLPGDQVVQVGIAGFANAARDRRWCEEQGIDVVTAAEVRFNSIEDVLVEALDRLALSVDRVFVELDVGVLDRSFAPGCGRSLPGGLWPRELLAAAFLAGRHPQVGVISIVGVDTAADVASVTTDIAALCLLNAAAGLRERLR